MGNVHAAAPQGLATPPLATPPPPTAPGAPVPPPPAVDAMAPAPSPSEDTGPGTFEDLHKRCKDLCPVPFEGAKLIVNKGLSNHFQVNHTLTMSSLQPSGYKFGCTFVGSKQFGPNEAFPIMIGEIEPSGDVNANIIHQFTKNLRCKFVSQIQKNKWVATQISSDYKGKDFTASCTLGNIDIVNTSGVVVSQYLQNVTKRLALGAELLYQYGENVPGSQIAIYTLAGRYNADKWEVTGNLTPAAGGAHVCYYHKVAESLSVGVELEGSMRTQECTATVAYQLEVPSANVSFRGQLDSNYCVGGVMEKKLLPLPFTFALSAFANHAKSAYRFGIGLIVG
ncbi:hypothetical protein CAPTEDRAFT_174847 [Capitella teleta]|uniref:Uncharacterized protein n=1 Tax=Capitella teleta TaxID=283909 RepID=R7V1D4_CAPTE|nr:hypothetical protein CAPTEDRAFT_174847 [Capitella teleta]|eukprot:ELU09501.1 hypothetical protein CAPTEDRAFT_174847 [Capitella teleta]